MHMKKRFIWVAIPVAAGFVLGPAAPAWSQEKEEVPARATWRPAAPERPEVPPGVQREENDFQIERPELELPGEEPESESEPEPGPEPGAQSAAEDAAPDRETPPEPAADTQPSAVEEPLPETRVESPDEPAAVAAASSGRADRTPPVPEPGTAVQPEYPRDALRRGQEGFVALRFTVTAGGEVANVAITDAEPEGVFEDPVRDAITQWRFQPATRDGEPVEQRVRHRFDFSLDR